MSIKGPTKESAAAYELAKLKWLLRKQSEEIVTLESLIADIEQDYSNLFYKMNDIVYRATHNKTSKSLQEEWDNLTKHSKKPYELK